MRETRLWDSPKPTSDNAHIAIKARMPTPIIIFFVDSLSEFLPETSYKKNIDVRWPIFQEK